MKINEKQITDKKELLEIFKNGTNPFNYIESDSDIDFIVESIIAKKNSEDSFFDDMAEVVLESIMRLLRAKEDEEKSLKRCKEIVEIGINSREKMDNIIEKSQNDSVKMLFKPINMASDKTYNEILETLNKKLSEIVK